MKHFSFIQSEFIRLARTWDELTLEEQRGYLSRHPRTKRKLTAGPTLRSETSGRTVLDPNRGHAFKILKTLRSELGVEGEPAWRKYLTYRTPGGQNNKYHYFSIFPKNGGFVAANAYGRIGEGDIRVHVIGEAKSKDEVLQLAEYKLLKKMKKGYEPTAL